MRSVIVLVLLVAAFVIGYSAGKTVVEKEQTDFVEKQIAITNDAISREKENLANFKLIKNKFDEIMAAYDSQIEASWGRGFEAAGGKIEHFKTKTSYENGIITIGPAEEDDPQAKDGTAYTYHNAGGL